MARQLRHFREAPRECSYLPGEQAQLEHRVLLETTAGDLEHLLDRGWRRFGPDYFRPACPACSACKPTRVPVSTFVPSKSQRRAARKCAALERTVGPPQVDEERLSLYAEWHAGREETRGWSPGGIDESAYRMQFAWDHPSAREIAWREPETGALVGLSVCDETPNVWSAVYFFYAARWAARSIGVANVLFQIELARSVGIAHVHLGYLVEACASLRYKGAYQPQEQLVGWPGLREAPIWAAAPESGDPADPRDPADVGLAGDPDVRPGR